MENPSDINRVCLFGDKQYWIPGCKFEKASTPIPPDGSIAVKKDADLMWLEGYKADSHEVYFGESESSVGHATKSSSHYKGRFDNNIFEPGELKADTPYYWRIDAVKAGTTVKGNVWQFTSGSPLPGPLPPSSGCGEPTWSHP